MAEIQTRGASRARSAFDQSCLNLPQFVQLMETFVGEDTSLPTVKRLVAFIKRGYIQTEEEKLEQLEKVNAGRCCWYYVYTKHLARGLGSQPANPVPAEFHSCPHFPVLALESFSPFVFT